MAEVEKIIMSFEGLPLKVPSPNSPPQPPPILRDLVGRLEIQYPEALITLTMHYVAVSSTQDLQYATQVKVQKHADSRMHYLPRLTCLDCPGISFPYQPGTRLGEFKQHLGGPLHTLRVERRLSDKQDSESQQFTGSSEYGSI